MSDPRWIGPGAMVWGLVCGLTDENLERRTLVMLRAYIDDSGRREHSPVFVLGGWIAPIVKWAEFVPDWQRMLDLPPGLEYFRMNEAAKLRDQFDSWSEERRDQRLVTAYEAIEKHVTFQVSCIVRLEEFYRVFDDSAFEQSAINPYYLAFSGIISGVARQQHAFELEDSIDFIFDDQVMEKGKIFGAWDAFKAHASPDTRPLIGSVPYFLDDKKFKPLQAADLIAWWIRNLATNGPENVKLPWTAKRSIPGFQFHYDEKKLKEVRETILRAVEASGGA